MSPELIVALGGAAGIGAIIKAIADAWNARHQGEADAAATNAATTASLAATWQTTLDEMRQDLDSLKVEVSELREERGALAEELAALRSDVSAALVLLRTIAGTPAADAAVAILDKPRSRRKKAAAPVAEAA